MLGLACLEVHNHQQTLALSHRYLDGFLQPFVCCVLYCHPVNDNLDIMILVPVYLHALGDLLHFAVDAHM